MTVDIHQNTILLGDCRDILSQFPDQSIDLVIADPPYYIMNKADLTFTTRSNIRQSAEFDTAFKSYDDFLIFTRQWLSALIPKLNTNASIYCFFATQFLTDLLRLGEDRGLIRKNILIWEKANPVPRVRLTNYVSAYESIVFFVKNYPTFNYSDINHMHNCLHYPLPSQTERIKDPQGNTLHPTQKPIKLIKQLIRISSEPKQVVCDPFVGSGTTNIACHELGRYCIGIEQNAIYHTAGVNRLTNTKRRSGKFADQQYLDIYQKK